jgi:hypothetical protein
LALRAYAAEGDADAAGDQFTKVVLYNRNFFATLSDHFTLESASFDLPPQVINWLADIRPANADQQP